MGLAKQKSDFEKDLVGAGVDLIKKERAGEVKWEVVTFYSKRAQRLIDEYEALVASGGSVASLEVDKDIAEMVGTYQMRRMEIEARGLLESVKRQTEELEAMMA